MKDRFRDYVSLRHDALQDEFVLHAPKTVYMLDRSKEDDPQMDFVFADITALQNVRFRHFMRDCRALQGGADGLSRVILREEQAAVAFLHEHHQDILKNFDPTIVKFRKKRKIVVVDGALDDLL